MWTGTASASLPASAISATARSQASALRLATTTLAPWAAKPWAMDSPMPRLPPVTMATRPDRSNIWAASSDAVSGRGANRGSVVESAAGESAIAAP